MSTHTQRPAIISDVRTESEFPLETERRLNEVHGGAPIEAHLDILFQDARVAGLAFLPLFRRCLEQTGTVLTPFNVFQRFQSRLSLLQYFLSTLAVPGARAECGVYRGATALLLAQVWRSAQQAFRGEDFYLIDSFAGASRSGAADLIAVRDDAQNVRMEAFFPPGRTDTSAALVRGFFHEFPQTEFCTGWIPQVFSTLPERTWAFVHLDATLYEPTLATLEYFYPRLNRGGVIVCDDYGSIFCPGSQKAWDEYCSRHGIAFIVLANRQSIILKT